MEVHTDSERIEAVTKTFLYREKCFFVFVHLLRNFVVVCKKYPEVLVPGCVKDAKMMPKVVSTGRYKSSIVVPSCGSHKTLFPDKSVSARIPTPPPSHVHFLLWQALIL